MVHSECTGQSNSAVDKTDHECANALVLREIVGKENNIVVLRLNRPKRLNALCEQLIDELLTALEEYDKNENVKVIVITGSDRVFSAGADIKEMCTKSFAEITMAKFPSNWNKITALNKPLIAAVNGFAFGGGFELALMCDIVYASESALFAQPEITIGTIPGAGGTQRLTRIAGKSLAMEMCLTGDKMSATEAKDCGIVSKVFPGEVLLDETIKLAEKIARNSSLISAIVKESVNNAYETTLQQGLATERKLFHSTFATNDIKEGMQAFIEKRSPKWSNQ